MNKDIALLLPDNTPAPEPKHFPDNVPVEHWLRDEHILKRTYTRKQVSTITRLKQSAIELMRAHVPKQRIVDTTGIEWHVLDALETQGWENVALTPKGMISALRQTGARFAAKAVQALDKADVPFRDLAGAATGFIARANDMDMVSSIGSSNQAEDQAIPVDSTQSSPRDRVLALLKA